MPRSDCARARARWTALAALAVAGSFVGGCGQQTVPCGTFTFTGSPNGNRGENINNSFAFSPAACSARCTCAQIAYVQIVRIIDRDTGNFLSPSTEQTDREVTGDPDDTQNGWAVDRIDGRIWGYYARNNDGSFAGYLTPGSNSTSAVLGDGPSGWPDNAWFDAVDVPICLDANASCSNNMLGYYYWLFIVEPGGTTKTPTDEIGVDWNRDALDKAVARWNATASGVHKNSFPAFTRLSTGLGSSNVPGCSVSRVP
jgi:hypothetical protein